MNAVEIEAALSDLSDAPFNPEQFPYAFLAAFGHKDTVLNRLKAGSKSGGTNASDLAASVLLRNHIHLTVCAAPTDNEANTVHAALQALQASPASSKAKAKFLLATDGLTLEAQDLASGETLNCDYCQFVNHFGFFLPLAGISTIKEIKDNPIDIRATGRLNKLYIALLEENPDWAKADRRHDMNHFMARLVFCFFAEDTDIFNGDGLFTHTLEQFSQADGSNTHVVVEAIFRAMNLKNELRQHTAPPLPNWAGGFPYVNGGLFSGSTEVPRFTRMARNYLLNVGALKWREINPDIFGSMIQAVADDDERGALGMHYTSVPNILKVLNPLFLDDLRTQLEAAGDNKTKLLNLRKRIARIRVFDPACGSGNFLVIAYKQLRGIEAVINERRGEQDQRSEIPLTNFRGIELRDFPAEIARLALIIAEFQCDVLYRGQKDALAEFLPLNAENWIVCGNALRLDWLGVCPPTGSAATVRSDDFFHAPTVVKEIDFQNEGGETYICGNPPYKGSQTQDKEQKADLAAVFDPYGVSSKQIDYVGGWFMKAAAYAKATRADTAFVSTNSICQGRIVPLIWPKIFETGSTIHFAQTSFKWANLASHNAGVTVAIVGLTTQLNKKRQLFDMDSDGQTTVREAVNITPYLTIGADVVVNTQRISISSLPEISFGNMPIDGGHLLLSNDEVAALKLSPVQLARFIRRIYGSAEFIRGLERYCLWIEDAHLAEAMAIDAIAQRVEGVRTMRLASKDSGTREMAITAHQFREMYCAKQQTIIVPAVSSEARAYLPVGLLDESVSVSNSAFALYDAPLWNLALIASRLHLVWIGTVCGKLKNDFRYSNTLGWNTFPVPLLTEQQKADLTECAQNILLAREAHFPATIADLYDPLTMPDNLRAAHARNDAVLERIYIGRIFKNDTERLEKLFELYTAMTAKAAKPVNAAKGKKA